MATGGLGRRVALRFVAGEDIDHAIEAIRAINEQGASASVDYLGENVTDLEQAKAAASVYLATLDQIATEGLSAGISVKLTQLGLDVDAAFAHLANRLITSTSYAMFATHDERLIDHVLKQVARTKRAPGTYEFQMLFGVRRELQRKLVADGYRLRVYVPFGSEWYPYLTRRIAERPANVRFFLESLARG